MRRVALLPTAIRAIKDNAKFVTSYRTRAREAYAEWALTFPSEAGTPIGYRNLIRTVEELRETEREAGSCWQAAHASLDAAVAAMKNRRKA